MSFVPPKPSGSSRFATFVQAVWDLLWGRESLFISTPESPIRFDKQTDGKYLPIMRAAVGGGGFSLRMYVLIEEFNDYTRCAALSIDEDGIRSFTSGDSDVYIAKPPELRHDIAFETIDGEEFTYTYSDEHTRVATAEDASTETQVVTPWYLIYEEAGEETLGNVGTIIYAGSVAGGTGVWREVETDVWSQLTLLEQSGREWARQDATPP